MLNIAEENDKELLNSWFQENPVSIDTFVEKLNHEYGHDYGTACYAVAAAAYAAARKVALEQGITGFQAGAAFWIFKRYWLDCGDPKPARLVDYSNMLYPQYGDTFSKTITQEIWEWIHEEAKRLLNAHILAAADGKPAASPAVVAHWESIVAGYIPFGYEVEGEQFDSLYRKCALS